MVGAPRFPFLQLLAALAGGQRAAAGGWRVARAHQQVRGPEIRYELSGGAEGNKTAVIVEVDGRSRRGAVLGEEHTAVCGRETVPRHAVEESRGGDTVVQHDVDATQRHPERAGVVDALGSHRTHDALRG